MLKLLRFIGRALSHFGLICMILFVSALSGCKSEEEKKIEKIQQEEIKALKTPSKVDWKPIEFQTRPTPDQAKQ
jgi:cell division protein FtsB